MISLDDETCIECGLCVDLLPQYFEVVEGKVRVKPGIDAAQADAAAVDIVDDCPSGAICR
jgi:ferredoxin